MKNAAGNYKSVCESSLFITGISKMFQAEQTLPLTAEEANHGEVVILVNDKTLIPEVAVAPIVEETETQAALDKEAADKIAAAEQKEADEAQAKADKEQKEADAAKVKAGALAAKNTTTKPSKK